MKKNKVAILTTFYSHDQGYSLCHCVEDQIRMLVDNGYKIKLIVDEDFKSPGGYWSHPNVTYTYTPKGIPRSNEGELPDDWKKHADKLYTNLKAILKDVDVVLTHDVVLQPAHLLWNVACRWVDKELPIRWLHWSHSPTAPQIKCNIKEISSLIKNKFPNSLYCYPNSWDTKRVAVNYDCELDEVKTVHHPSDFVSLLCGDEDDFNERGLEAWKLTRDFVNDFKLLDADVISVYPCRLDRGKQPEFLIKTMAKIKESGRSVRCVIVDFHSTGGDKVTYREELKTTAKEWGLTEKECIFTSEWKEETRYNMPRAFVMNLKKFSDFQMHPSNTETYSLVVQEGMATKNFSILNYHTPQMRDIYGSKNVYYEQFGATVNALDGSDGTTSIQISNPQEHFEILAKKVLYFVENNPILAQWRFIRQKRNTNYVFKHELESLLYKTELGENVHGTKPN